MRLYPTILTCFITLLSCGHLNAQSVKRDPVQKIITELMERFIENEEARVDYTDLQEQLEFFSTNKININNADHNTLKQLVFLSDKDIVRIVNHRAKHGDFVSVFELQAVPDLSEQTLYYLSYFVQVEGNLLDEQKSFTQMLASTKKELIYLHENEFEPRLGYAADRKENNLSYYQGNPFRSVVRLRATYANKLYVGYAGEKDMGEPFLTVTNRAGYDFNSWHFLYRPNKGILRTLAVGDYQINFGQGLVFGSGLSARKSAYVSTVQRNFQHIRPYRSLNENEFLRGTAITLKRKQLELTSFYSRKFISTNLSTEVDEALAEEAQFSSIQVTGLHRTATELANKHNVLQQIAGGNLHWQHDQLKIGVTAVHTWYNKAFAPGTEPYQLYNLRGKQLTNMGFNYSFNLRNAWVFGEAGMSDNGSGAFTSGLSVPLASNLDVTLLYRNFSKSYQTTYANPFAENNDARNEQGFYTGINLRISRKFTFVQYYDFYRSPWLRYLVDGPSTGMDVLSELQYTPSKTVLVYLRYRHESKLRNQAENTANTDYLSKNNRSQLRLHAQVKASDRWTIKSRFEHITFTDERPTTARGNLLFQDIAYSGPRKKTTLTGRFAVFNVDDYQARVYASEQDVLYQFAVPLYQNSGIRYFFMLHQHITKKIDCWIKYSYTQYSNVSSISSGLQLINSNTLSDIRIQLRITL